MIKREDEGNAHHDLFARAELPRNGFAGTGEAMLPLAAAAAGEVNDRRVGWQRGVFLRCWP